MKSLVAVLAVFYCCVLAVQAGDAPKPDEEGVSLTVYREGEEMLQFYQQYGGGMYQYYDASQGRYVQRLPGWGVVKVRRKMPLKEGLNVVRFQDVAASIDATTVLVSSLTDPKNTFVQEQNFEFDLVNPDKIMQKYVDRPLSVVAEGGETQGELLSFDAGNLVLKTANPATPISVIARPQNVREIRFSSLPGGLITRPTLVWHLDAKKEADHLIQCTYQTGNIAWKADYTATISADEKNLELAAWVTMENRSGVAYPNARLKLIAGDVQRVMPANLRFQFQQYGQYKGKDGRDRRPQFEEKSFFEYHLYTLERPTTLENNSEKQIELFTPVVGVPLNKRLVYYGGRGMYNYNQYGGQPNQDRNFGVQTNTKVNIYLEFKNEKEMGLGIPLPAGRMRVYKRDPEDKAMEFIGEDEIDHTPKGENVRLRMGSAFNVTGERRQTAFECKYNEHWITESFEIKLRNHKQEDVEVLVQEDLYRWINAEITESSHKHERVTSQRVIFPVKVEKDKEAVLTYTVKYTW